MFSLTHSLENNVFELRPGLDSMFQGRNRLVCGHVAICQGPDDKAHLVLEGAICEEFDRIKEVIYSQYSVC